MATEVRSDDTSPARGERIPFHVRRESTLTTAQSAGLLGEKDGRIASRVPQRLVQAAKDRSGIQSDTDLIEYALAKVALEDDFGERLLAHKGSVRRDLDLEF